VDFANADMLYSEPLVDAVGLTLPADTGSSMPPNWAMAVDTGVGALEQQVVAGSRGGITRSIGASLKWCDCPCGPINPPYASVL